MKILVTGGLGYIGSHVTVLLLQKGYEVISVDNLDNSSLKVLDGIESITGNRPFFEAFDVRNEDQMSLLFDKFPEIDGVIHFAAHKAVGESVENPLKYYENNISGLVQILKPVIQKSIPFIFSSSCTVYGQADQMPITEMAAIKKAESPYGNTKQIGEEIIQDTCRVSPNINATALRYFNPIGAHQSALIGELPIGVPQNLVPYITQTATGQREQLSVFGDNYPTPDGTAIRDYIHVVDLAQAHVTALKKLLKNEQATNFDFYNVGTGKGSSVLEVITAFETVTGKKLNYKIVDKREGDVTQAFADTTKANNVLGWKAEHTLEQALLSAWNWEQKQ